MVCGRGDLAGGQVIRLRRTTSVWTEECLLVFGPRFRIERRG
jgi:hypothetical protein